MVKRLIISENDVKDVLKRMLDSLNAWSFAPVQHGLGAHGIPDRIACVPVTITPEMVGRTVGLFVGVEAKKPGRRGEELAGATGMQLHQLREIAEACGTARLVDCQDDVLLLRTALTENIPLGADPKELSLTQVKGRTRT